MSTTIISILKDITSIAEKFIQAKSKRRTAVFQEIIHPMYDRLLEIHTNYYNMFTELRNAMPEKIGEDEYELESCRYTFEELQNDVDYKEAISNFLQERSKEEFVRDCFRYAAHSLLLATTDKKERRFVFTVINYFMEDGISETPLSLSCYIDVTIEDYLDNEIEEVISQKGYGFYETPSFLLAGEMKITKDSRSLIDSFLTRINNKFFLASDQFVKLKYSVYSKQL